MPDIEDRPELVESTDNGPREADGEQPPAELQDPGTVRPDLEEE